MPDGHPPLKLKTSGLIACRDNHDKDPDEDGAKQLRKLERREKSAVYWERIVIIFVLVFLCLAILCVFVWHLIMPSSLRWLSEAEIETIKNISLSTFGGLLGTVATNYFLKK